MKNKDFKLFNRMYNLHMTEDNLNKQYEKVFIMYLLNRRLVPRIEFLQFSKNKLTNLEEKLAKRENANVLTVVLPHCSLAKDQVKIALKYHFICFNNWKSESEIFKCLENVWKVAFFFTTIETWIQYGKCCIVNRMRVSSKF